MALQRDSEKVLGFKETDRQKNTRFWRICHWSNIAIAHLVFKKPPQIPPAAVERPRVGEQTSTVSHDGQFSLGCLEMGQNSRLQTPRGGQAGVVI